MKSKGKSCATVISSVVSNMLALRKKNSIYLNKRNIDQWAQ